MQAGLEQLPQVDSSELDFDWEVSVIILCTCTIASAVTLLWTGGRKLSINRLRCCCCCLRSSRSTPESSLEQGLLNPELEQERQRPGTRDYRQEFLLFGLLHGLLAFSRELLIRDGLPRTWGILENPVAAEVGIQQLRSSLSQYDVSSDGRKTVLDEPFKQYDWCLSLSLTLQFLLLLLVCVSLLCERKGLKQTSQASIFVAAALAVTSALSTFVPNYTELTQLPEDFKGCGKQFDSLVQFVISGVLGMIFAAPLGLQAFGVLFAIPISAVRGIWLVMMRPEMQRCMQKVLQGSLWLLALLIPCITVFPLLFLTQLTEDELSEAILMAFWLVPSFLIVYLSKQTSETWFYFLWLLAYVGLMGLFLFQQARLFKVTISDVLGKIDIPWLWSMMHADFCLTNVFVTDLVSWTHLGNLNAIQNAGQSVSHHLSIFP